MASSPSWKCSGFLPGGGWGSLPGPQAWSWILGELWNLGVPKTRQLRWIRKSREMVWGCCRALKGWEQWGLHKKSPSVTICPNQLSRESFGLQISPCCSCTILRNYQERFLFLTEKSTPPGSQSCPDNTFQTQFSSLPICRLQKPLSFPESIPKPFC